MAGERAEYTLRYLVHASPKAVFEVLTDARQITRYTRAPAVSEARAGGKYEAFDGSIQGEFVACSEEKIEMKWRMKGWEDGASSKVVIKLTPKGDGSTRLELHHSDIPVHDRFGNGGQNRSAEGGWKERIFGGIKSIIGFGMEEED